MDQEQNPSCQTEKTLPHASGAELKTPPRRFVPNPVDVTIGINLRRIRKELKMSQYELGDILGVSFQQIQKYEQGINRLTISRALDLCRIIHMSISDLVVQLLQPRPKK